MPDDGPTSDRLDTLRQRWEADRETERGSGVFLQLADEYRRLGRTGDAITVLEEGLEKNPNHPAALVALGRSRLETGDAAGASEVLEKVIAADPTQMVAYRLLVEAYVERGMAEEARQRLRVYSLLNDADPEIAELRRRIGEVERRHRDEPAPSEPARTAGAAAEPSPEPSPEPSDEPFPLLSGPDDRRRYLESLEGGELFGPGSGAEAPPAAADPDADREPEPARAAGFEWPTPPAEPTDDLFELGGETAAPAPDLGDLLEDREGEPAADGAAEAPAETEARPTVTLGRLYLRQGHREEAADIFRQVLDRDPGNAEAREELDRLGPFEDEPEVEAEAEAGSQAVTETAGDDGPPPLTAAELLESWDGRRDPDGLTARKRHMLERYLDRIRRRSAHDVH